MKPRDIWGVSSALCLGAAALQAQETNQVQQLRQQLQQLQENFEKTQQQYRQQFEALQRQIDALQPGRPAAPAEQKKLEEEIAAKLGPATTAPASPANPTPGAKAENWSPSQPITVMRAGSAYMNISFDALMDFGWSTASDPSKQLQLGDHDPAQRGFSLRNAEISLDGAVDPYFKGFANMVFKLDQNNETEFEWRRPSSKPPRSPRTCK